MSAFDAAPRFLVPKTPAAKHTRFADTPADTPYSQRSTPFTPFSARSYAQSPAAYSTPASSVNMSPVAIKRKQSLADLAHNWRDRALGFSKPTTLPDLLEDDGLLPVPRFLANSGLTQPSPSPPPPKIQYDIVDDLTEPFSSIRVSIPKPTVSLPPPAQPSFAAPLFDSHMPLPLPRRAHSFACSVCDFASFSRGDLTVLEPCAHLLCRACMTNSLNIVGEKTFACMACESPVQNFYLLSSSAVKSSAYTPSAPAPPPPHPPAPRPLSCAFSALLLPQTPAACTVLRIDNCPWDVTPPMLREWCSPTPITTAHVMLDRKGKTLSHAFVETSNSEDARSILRLCRTKILGHGRRARGVTITLSSQEELMKNLFPTWEGRFEGLQPTLDGVPRETAHSAIARGLISAHELDALLDLVQHPESVFLKSPSLPFYVLTTILSKLPADADSRLLWPVTLRLRLFRLTISALDTLLSNLSGYDAEVLPGLLSAAMGCRAFAHDEREKIRAIFEFVADIAMECTSASQ
ncbi:hypothetical protein AURDEDRAFT_156516 [Auricularia subglabra TFB-10046 SS5]|nr:hypothetical protein AURDEDRAFT_156516 [Auricularia subglabra TFB-10046 SS5]